jgi:hypothetical protein
MIEDDRRNASSDLMWPGKVRRYVFDAVEVEIPGFENVAVAGFFASLLSAYRTLAIRQIAEQRIELAAPITGALGSVLVDAVRHERRQGSQTGQ